MKEYDEEERLEHLMKSINPKDIGVTFGKPMTEAEFLEHRKNTGETPHIIKAGPKNKSEPIQINDPDPKKKLREKLDAMARDRK